MSLSPMGFTDLDRRWRKLDARLQALKLEEAKRRELDAYIDEIVAAAKPIADKIEPAARP